MAPKPTQRVVRPNTVLHSRAIVACLLSVLLGLGCAARSRRAAPTGAPAGITWLIFVDDLHMDFRNTGHVRDLFRSISTALIRDEDVFAMRSSGRSFIAIGPSSDGAIFDAAIPAVAGNGLQPLDINYASKSETDEIELRLAVTFSAASNLLGVVPASPDRRRAVLYISNGYDSQRGRDRASRFSRVARRANVIVFAVNAGGVPGSLPMDGRVDAALWKRVVASRRQSLRAIAEPTGGFALLDEMDFADAMSRIRAACLRNGP